MEDDKIIEFRKFIQKFKNLEINNRNDDNQTQVNREFIFYNIRYPKSTSYFRKIHHHKMKVIIKKVPNPKYIIDNYVENLYINNKKFDTLINYYKNNSVLILHDMAVYIDRYI